MPIKDGYEFCTEMRTWERTNRRAHIPIIALSANVLGDVYGKCAEAGFNSYVTKPVDFNELHDVLIQYLDPPGGIEKRRLEFMKISKASKG
jgi:CheY-like chemotaxis protein